MEDENFKRAVALRYEKDLVAPQVIAKGTGNTALRIIEIAKENGIEIIEDSETLDLLYKLDIEDFIPEELYQVIAEILAYVFEIAGKEILE